jgi:hypothetical protein
MTVIYGHIHLSSVATFEDCRRVWVKIRLALQNHVRYLLVSRERFQRLAGVSAGESRVSNLWMFL